MNTKRNLTLARDILISISNNTNNKKFKYIGKSDYYRAKRFKKENSEEQPLFKKYKRGTILFVDFGTGVGNEFSLPHFAIVLDKKDHPKKGLLTVIPLSSKNKKQYISLGDNLITNLVNEANKYSEKVVSVVQRISDVHKIHRLSGKKKERYVPNDDETRQIMREFVDRHNPKIHNLNDYIANKWISDEKQWINEISEYYKKFNKNTYAAIDNIQTISKLRVVPPKNPADPIGKATISENNMELIDIAVLKKLSNSKIDIQS